MKIPTRQRSSYTLVELLIVLAIITLLTTLVVGAYFRVSTAAQFRATQASLTNLDSAYNKAMKKVMEDCRREQQNNQMPPVMVTLAGGDTNRALVIYQKLRLQREFPMTFNEALNPNPSGLQLQDSSGNVPTSLQPKQAYVDKLQTAGVTFASLQFDQPPSAWESSVCLALALEQSRGGGTVTLSTLGPIAVKTCPAFPPLNAIVDSYGNPIYFYRWATSFPPFNPATFNPNQKNDKDDPDGTLSVPSWVNGDTGLLFQSHVHAVGAGQSYVTQHVIVSMGPQGSKNPLAIEYLFEGGYANPLQIPSATAPGLSGYMFCSNGTIYTIDAGGNWRTRN